MKYIKVILAVIIGIVLITAIVEGIEFTIVKLISKKSFAYLSTHQEAYFDIRNTTWILIAKLLYSVIAAVVGGFVASWIAQPLAKIAIITLISTQAIAIFATGFLSKEMSSTAPTWIWVALFLLLPLGIWLGYSYWKKRNHSILG